MNHKLQVLAVQSPPSATPSTNTELYRQLDVRLVPTLEFSSTATQSPDWTQENGKPLFANPPKPGSSETKVVQPYWTDDILPRLPKDKVDLVDRHEKTSFGSRKPDIVGYAAGQPQSVAHIVLIGELKARRAKGKAEFDDDEKGQLESFLEDLLIKYQPWRKQMYGFLSDGLYIQFFELRPASPESGTKKHTLLEAPVLSLCGDGARWLAGLLERPGYNGLRIECQGKTVLVDSYLGSGGSAIVFSGSWDEQEVVIKRFHRPGALDQEKRNLDKVVMLADQGLVPRAIASTEDDLILQPIGDSFVSMPSQDGAIATRHDFEQLIDILKQAHQTCGLVHRDVRLNNFFRAKGTNKVFLNDWGSAVAVGQLTRFEGALQHAPDLLLDSWQRDKKYKPAFSHDLEMVVRSVFHSTNMVLFCREAVREDDPVKLRQFWARHLAPLVWSRMVHAAQECDYDGLKRLIAELLP